MNLKRIATLSIMAPTLFLAECAQASDNDHLPFRTYASSPYQAISLSNQLRSGFVNDKTEVFLSGSVASIWAQSDEFELDYYQNQAFVGLHLNPIDKLEVELMYQYSWAGDNKLDSIVKDFHDAFGFEQNGRDNVKDDQFNIIDNISGNNINNFKDETLASAFHAYAQYQVFNNENHGISIGGSLYYNDVDHSPFKKTSFEQGLQVNYSYRNDSHSVHTSLGLVHRDDEQVLGSFDVKDTTLSFSAAYNFRFFEKHDVMVQYNHFEGVLEEDSPFSEASQEIVLGYRYSFNKDVLLELTTIENIENMDNSTDINFGAGIRVMFN